MLDVVGSVFEVGFEFVFVGGFFGKEGKEVVLNCYWFVL